jgi:hypothetical protein
MKARHNVVKQLALSGLLAGVVATAAPVTAAAAIDDKEIKLSGCLVRGDGDGAGYFLTNTPTEPSLAKTTDASVTPSALGTSGSYSTIFYWLDDDGDLETHVGNRVEIEGIAGDAPKDGDIKLDRKDKWTELTVKADGRTMKANVPHTSSLPAPGKDGDVKSDIIVKRVDVNKVKMLAASCAN